MKLSCSRPWQGAATPIVERGQGVAAFAGTFSLNQVITGDGLLGIISAGVALPVYAGGNAVGFFPEAGMGLAAA